MENAHILITGGSSGIGLAVTEKVVAGGAIAHITGRRLDMLEAVQERLGERVQIYAGDVGIAKNRETLMREITQRTDGKLDGLVINAARYGFTHLVDMSVEEFEAYFQVNTIASWHLMKMAHPLLLAGDMKSVVMVSSTLGARPIAGTGAYAASKAALNSLTQCFSLEWADQGIRVNAVLPGVVDTNIHEPQTPNDPTKEEKFSQVGPMHPLGRVGSPKEVASAVNFLLSTQSSWTTGSLFFVDGGISLV